MPLETTSPVVTQYKIIVAGTTLATFTECRDIGTKYNIIEHIVTDPYGKPMIRKLPGDRMLVHNVVLTRQATQDLGLLRWRSQVEAGDMKNGRKSGEIVGLDPVGQPVVRWTFMNGWPSKLVTNIPDLTEEVTLAIEKLSRVL
ncbi:MAG: hypothetical protein AVDCRST_MAG93-8002 [uncultured Chloroflexia bacterium]|uniref:Phage tail protein n=1 Tax=uncultured Chloroflexia bacterium TaxID=1672391 RepID=A0A6J4MT43_9CHLR|nr:MAG: hypothetical protein AVDCRST_MAG93-8002 [uncultured Chloroflexia bacterium]